MERATSSANQTTNSEKAAPTYHDGNEVEQTLCFSKVLITEDIAIKQEVVSKMAFFH